MTATQSTPPQVDRLPNGMRVVTETMPHVRSVSVGIWVASGSRHETGADNGLSHFIEHMLFKGSGTRSAEDIARAVDSIGGNLDAFTSKEMVCFNTKVLDEHLPQAFDILADLVLNPRFDEADIGKEKGVILEELKMEVDNPEYLVHEIFSASFWKGHTLGKPILGTKESIKAFTRDQIAGFYQRTYRAPNMLLSAAGNVTHVQMLEMARKYFGGLPNGEFSPAQPAPHPHARVILRHKRSLEQVHLCLGVPSCSAADEGRFASYVLNTMLGGGMSSRLFQNIREKRGLAYSVFSEQYLYRDAGCLSIYAGTSLSTVRQVIELILEEFRDLKRDEPPAEELRRAKDHLKGSLILSLESTSSRMSNNARQYLYYNRFTSLDEMARAIEAVTGSQVAELANRHFAPGRIAVTVLGNIEGLRLARGDLAC